MARRSSRPSRSPFRAFDSQRVQSPRPVQDVWPSRCDRATIEARMRASHQEVDIYEPLHSQNPHCPYKVCYIDKDGTGTAHHYNIQKQSNRFYVDEGQGFHRRTYSSLPRMLEHLRIYQYSPGARSDPQDWQNLPVQNMVSERAQSVVPVAPPSVSQPPIVRRSSSAQNRTQTTSSHPSAPRPSLSVDQALSQLSCYRSDLPEWALGVTLKESSLPFLVSRQSQTHQPVLVYFTGHMQQLPIRQNNAQEFYIDHPRYRECHFSTMSQLLRYHEQHGLLSCPAPIQHLYLDHTH